MLHVQVTTGRLGHDLDYSCLRAILDSLMMPLTGFGPLDGLSKSL